MVHLVLVSPEIPANVGNIMRTAVALDATLHIIRPTPIKFDEKSLKRAGLDYLNNLTLEIHDDFTKFWASKQPKTFYLLSRYGSVRYDKVSYPLHENIYLIFGNESSGLPQDLLKEYAHKLIRIPMVAHARSLNLSNSAAIVLSEVKRQQEFANLATHEVIKRKLT